jgi:hypothetical protein
MLGSLEGKKYTTDWDGFFRLLPGFATVVGEEYLNTIPIDDDNTLINTEVFVSITEDEVNVSYSGYTHKIKLFQLDQGLESRLKHMLHNKIIKEVLP